MIKYHGKKKLYNFLVSNGFDVPKMKYMEYKFYRGSEWLKYFTIELYSPYAATPMIYVTTFKENDSKTEAENFAAANPVEKGVKITATKSKPSQAKKETKTPPPQKRPKPSGKQTSRKQGGKVVSFNEGRAKYGKK